MVIMNPDCPYAKNAILLAKHAVIVQRAVFPALLFKIEKLT